MWEPGIETNPLSWDTDGDGYGDALEFALGSDPLDSSTDLPVLGVAALAAQMAVILLLFSRASRMVRKHTKT